MNNSSSPTIVSMLVGLVLTAFLYGIGPVLLSVFRKKIISKSSLIQFSILYSAAISVLFVIVRYWVDGAVRVNDTRISVGNDLLSIRKKPPSTQLPVIQRTPKNRKRHPGLVRS